MQFMQYSWKVGNAMGSLMTMYNEQHKSLAAATRVLRAIARRPRIERGAGLRPDGFKGLVELRDVTFAYPTRPETPVLRRLNLTLVPGTVTALVRGCRARALLHASPATCEPAVACLLHASPATCEPAVACLLHVSHATCEPAVACLLYASHATCEPAVACLLHASHATSEPAVAC